MGLSLLLSRFYMLNGLCGSRCFFDVIIQHSGDSHLSRSLLFLPFSFLPFSRHSLGFKWPLSIVRTVSQSARQSDVIGCRSQIEPCAEVWLLVPRTGICSALACPVLAVGSKSV